MENHKTTAHNPGSSVKRSPISIRRSAQVFFQELFGGHFKSAYFYLLTSLINIWNQLFFSNSDGKYYCPCCEQKAPYFIHLCSRYKITWNSACPNCDSRSRHRGLSVFLTKWVREVKDSVDFLHIAPEPVLKKVITEAKEINYKTCDYLLKDVDYSGEDIQSLSFKDHSYDFIFCNHVLEHVPEDKKAVGELARILRPGGKALLTVPGDWNRQETVFYSGNLPNGHYRDYGMDVVKLFESAFERVEVCDLRESSQEATGFNCAIKERELAFICSSPIKR